jgi:neopullulanase
MIRKQGFFIAVMILIPALMFAQSINIERVEPPFWWTGFSNPDVQLVVYGVDISNSRVSIDYPGVTLKQVRLVENPNYLFLDMVITYEAQPGIVPINFRQGRHSMTHEYQLHQRQLSDQRQQGFDSSDLIYLIMPDRFANGDPSNDEIPGMLEGSDRSEPYGRHGGDLKGISDNLDYIRDLGMTAIWLNPVFENDMPPNYSIGAGFYHGYAATDMYKVDRRFGSNEEFADLVKSAREKGLKVIMDMIHNHVGTHHWLIQDMPSNDWVHDQSVHGNTNYRTSTIMDPYASDADLNSTVKGWFVNEMPDLDQRNELLANYLIYNTIWWIEYSGIDGIRMDTHPYPYQDYMALWTRKVLDEFPDFNIVGEAWMPNVASTAWWQYESRISGRYNSYLPSVTDFPLYYALGQAFNEEQGWDTGITRLYYVLGQDFLYTDPWLNVIFVDNHDLTRYATTVGEDPEKFKLGLAFLYTTRGIPQVYYGTEIMMTGGGIDPNKRKDFPGGWQEDPINAFTSEGREQLNEEWGRPVTEVYEYVRNLSQWRRNKEVIHTGKLTHFIPSDNVYVYFRWNEDDTVMIVINGHEDSRTFSTERFSERIKGFTTGFDVISGREMNDLGQIQIDGKSAMILELN